MSAPFPGPLTATAPPTLAAVRADTAALGFDMASRDGVGRLLAALAAARPGGRLLELGTGTGAATAWLLHGMSADSVLDTVEADADLQALARRHLGGDPRVRWVRADAGTWLGAPREHTYDLVFADCWPGKFSHLDEALDRVAPGGHYVVDDLLPQDNWPEGHERSVAALAAELARRPGWVLSPLEWASGVLVATRR